MPISRKRSARRLAIPLKIREFELGDSVALRRLVEKAADARGRVLLREAVGDFGERLRRRDANRDRNARPLLDRAPQLARMRFEAQLETGELRNASSIE